MRIAAVDLQWLIACDLDQTLIYSRPAFRLPPGEPEPAVVVVEHLDGQPLSHVTRSALQGLRELASRVPLVPVTTRTLAQYQRVDLGFTPAYAIAANGGHLLVDGLPDAGWAAQVRQRLAAGASPMAQMQARALAIADEAAARGAAWVRTVREADGFFVYLVATERAAIPDLTTLQSELVAEGWSLSVQGRKVYLVPQALTKEAALAEVMRRTGAVRLAAAGDSKLDLGMLSMADIAIRPAHGELHEQGIVRGRTHPDHPEASKEAVAITVTAHAGLLGGQEVVDLLRNILVAQGDSRDSRDSRNRAMTFRSLRG